MKRFVFVLISILYINRCIAFEYGRPSGGRSAALGNTSVCERGLWSLYNNPAGLAFLKHWEAGLYYENLWMLKETAFKSAGFAKSIQGVGCLGLAVSQFGGSAYNENKFGIAYARDFGPYLQMGLELDYLLLHWNEAYPNQGRLSFELGIQSQITEKLRLGVYLFNPIQRKLGTLNSDALPIVMRFGMVYQFNAVFFGQCELEYNSSHDGISLRSGFEYRLHERFILRAGAQHNPNLLSFGIGTVIQRFHIDVATQIHQVLGASLHLGIVYKIQ